MPGMVELNDALDLKALAADFAREGRVQLRGALTPSSAAELRGLLAESTPWGIAARAPDVEGGAPVFVRAGERATDEGRERVERLAAAAAAAVGRGEYGYVYASYPMLTAYLERWAPGAPHEAILEDLNGERFLSAMRAITGFAMIARADAQATLFAPGHFLPLHHDSHDGQGRLVAYVLNLPIDDWRPDWGGQLAFYNEEGDIERAYHPRFNTLNLFAVPRPHAVTPVAACAPEGRFAITGWLRSL